MKRLLEPISTKRRLGGLGHRVDIHFISTRSLFRPLAAALRRPSISACTGLGGSGISKTTTATFLHGAVIRCLGSVTHDRLVDLQLLLRRVRQTTTQEL
jgi:hypothetical protein